MSLEMIRPQVVSMQGELGIQVMLCPKRSELFG